jgi:hypothetical protein
VKKAMSVPMLLVGVLLLATGFYAIGRGLDGRHQVDSRLYAQDIVTPADASIPSTRVHDAATAESMAKWVDGTIKKATGGRTYNEVGHYLTADGKDTDDVTKAALDATGQPRVNPMREIAFEASTGTTGLYTSVMGSHLAEVAIGLGIALAALGLAFAGTGIAFAGLSAPAMARRLHLHLPRAHHSV